jgi:hypothetical protein
MAARTRAHVVAIGVALAGLVLAGCANASVLDRTPSSEDSLARVQGAAARVTEAGSARFSMTVRTIFAGEQVAASTATTEGAYDYAAHEGQMDTTVKTAGIPFRFTERTLVIGSAVYMKMPKPPEVPDGGAAIGEGQHKPWVKLELPKEVAGLSGLGPGFGPGPGEGSGDPTEALRYLQAASSKVEVVGQEQVRGVPSTRYAVTFDPAKLAGQIPEELAGLLEESGLAFSRPADVWIDQQGRLRRMHYAVTMKVPGEATSATVTVETTLELYDFGVEVHVAPPPADQVEVIRPDLPPPGCTHQKGDGRAGSPGGATQDSGQAEAWACVERWGSAEHSGSTSP